MRRSALVLLYCIVQFCAVVCASLYDANAASREEKGQAAVLPSKAREYVFNGHSIWKMNEIFTSRTVTLQCSQQIQVYSGRSTDEVYELYRNRASSWCSTALTWDSFFQKGSKECAVTISPFGTTYMAVVPDETISRPIRLQCELNEKSELSLQLLVSGVAGLLLFLFAPPLAQSISFRISVGGALSVALCTLIVAIYCYRRIQHGRSGLSIIAGLGAIGASVTGIANLVFRFPDIPALVKNPWFLAYIIGSFFIGAAVSYYFDSSNPKIIDIIAAGLRLIGGSLVFYSLSQIWQVGAAVAFVLLLSVLLPKRTPPDPMLGHFTPEVDSPVQGLHSGRTPHDLSPEVDPEPSKMPWMYSRQQNAAQEYRENLPPVATGHAGHHSAEALSHFSPRRSPLTPPTVLGTNSSITAPVLSPSNDSPLLAAGLVLNSVTGRTIKIGGGTYQTLLDKGFSLDREAGAMVPPSRSPDVLGQGLEQPTSRQRHSRRASARSPMGGSGRSTETSPY